WVNKIYYMQIRLDPLTPASAEELLRALLGGDPDLAPLKALLIERAQGNPFFLEESARTLTETRVVAGERGAFRLAKPLSNIRVPPPLPAILPAPIHPPRPPHKRLLPSAPPTARPVS